MSQVIEEARAAIEQGLAEVNEESRKLEAALASLVADGHRDGTALAKAPRKRVPKAPPARPRKRARRGKRQEQFLKAVRANEGAPVSEIARTLGVAPQQLYPVAKRLLAAGQIAKDGRGYAPVSTDGKRA